MFTFNLPRDECTDVRMDFESCRSGTQTLAMNCVDHKIMPSWRLGVSDQLYEVPGPSSFGHGIIDVENGLLSVGDRGRENFEPRLERKVTFSVSCQGTGQILENLEVSCCH